MVNKRAFVTGGSRGIGKGISKMLAKNGYDLVINYRSNIEAAEGLKNELESEFGINCSLLQFDISEFENTERIITEEIEQNGAFDVLVINAGIRSDSIFNVMQREAWDSVIDVNLKSFYYITKPVSKAMFMQKAGKIVVVSSTSGLTGVIGQANYCASKFGLIGAAKSLALELARKNINVNIVAPGFIATEMIGDLDEKISEIKKSIPARKIGTVEDVANAVEFLVSEKSDYIYGQVIAVNGGVVL